jgi:hypothetical protein
MPEFPGEHGGKIFGLPPWGALLALGAAGVAGYFIFFKDQGGGGGAPARGQGTTGYSPYALAVMQNPDESATMAEQNRLLSVIGSDVTNGFSGIGTSLNGLSGQVGSGFAGVHDQVASNTYMNYYQAAYYASMQYAQAALTRGDQAGYDAWTKHAQQYLGAVEAGRVGGYGVSTAPNAPSYYGQPAAA